MKCPKCSHQNEDGALFCNNCGSALVEGKKDWTSILLLAWCVSMVFFFLVHTINNWLITPYILSNYDVATGFKRIHVIQTIISICATTFVVQEWQFPLRVIQAGFPRQVV